MQKEAQRRLTWIRLYEETRDVGFVCRRCGISSPTLRKWLRRYYEEQGEAGLVSQSRRPKTSPQRKVFAQEETWILDLRRERNFGAWRIQQELRRQHQYHLSLEAIHTVLNRHEVPPLRCPKRPQAPRRYNASLPGERVQMDTMKLATGLYQYTFIDDCTRYLVAALYSRRTAANTLDFFDLIFDSIPFPIQRLQTDNGTESVAYKVRDLLFEMRIKPAWRPPTDSTSHTASQREGRARVADDADRVLRYHNHGQLQLGGGSWGRVLDYNYRRVHGSLGKTPMERWSELHEQTPFWDDVAEALDPRKEITFVDRLTLRRRAFIANKRAKQ